MTSDDRRTSRRRPGSQPPARPSEDVAVVIPLRQKEKRAVSVARAILRDVRDEHLTPGTRLPPETTMLERYQVARGTLREALRILEVQGLISIKFGPEGGPVVREPTARDFSHVLTLFLQGTDVTLQHLFDARRVVEPFMAKLAADCDDEDKRDDLRAILRRTSAAAEWGDFAVEMAAFHSRVLSMSGNPVLDLWALTLQQAVNYSVDVPVPEASRDEIRRAHLAVGEAILGHDGDAAFALMAEHMDQQQRYGGHDDAHMRRPIEWR